MKPFDLEAAKRGDPICTTTTGIPCHFIGVMTDGRIAVEQDNFLYMYPAQLLRMAPKKVTAYFNVYRYNSGDLHCSQGYTTRKAADTYQDPNTKRIDVIEYTYEE